MPGTSAGARIQPIGTVRSVKGYVELLATLSQSVRSVPVADTWARHSHSRTTGLVRQELSKLDLDSSDRLYSLESLADGWAQRLGAVHAFPHEILVLGASPGRKSPFTAGMSGQAGTSGLAIRRARACGVIGLWNLLRLCEKWKTDGFVVLPSYLSANQLSRAIAELRLMFPSADEFHRQPDAEDYGRFSDEFGGIESFPFQEHRAQSALCSPGLSGFGEESIGNRALAGLFDRSMGEVHRVRRTSTSTITVTISVKRWSSLRTILAFSRWRCSSSTLTCPSISGRRRSSPAVTPKICPGDTELATSRRRCGP